MDLQPFTETPKLGIIQGIGLVSGEIEAGAMFIYRRYLRQNEDFLSWTDSRVR
jgi:hypothetical protein